MDIETRDGWEMFMSHEALPTTRAFLFDVHAKLWVPSQHASSIPMNSNDTHKRQIRPIGNSSTAVMIPHGPYLVTTSWSPRAQRANTSHDLRQRML